MPDATGDSEHSIDRQSRTIAKTSDGRLPESFDAKLYAGHGTNVICSGCDEKIMSDEIEFETDQTDSSILRFHAECYRAWKSRSPVPLAGSTTDRSRIAWSCCSNRGASGARGARAKRLIKRRRRSERGSPRTLPHRHAGHPHTARADARVAEPLRERSVAAVGYTNVGGTHNTPGLLFVNRASWAHILVDAVGLLDLSATTFSMNRRSTVSRAAPPARHHHHPRDLRQ
jgi:hypothetical protein